MNVLSDSQSTLAGEGTSNNNGNHGNDSDLLGILLKSTVGTIPFVQIILLLGRFLNEYFRIQPSFLFTICGIAWGSMKVITPIYRTVMDRCERSITICEGDETYDHVMRWLSNHPSIKNKRHLMVQPKQSDAWDGEEFAFATSKKDVEKNGVPQYLDFSKEAARTNRRFVPAIGSTNLWHRGNCFSFTRQRESFIGTDGFPALKSREFIRISCYRMSTEPIEDLLRHATARYHENIHQSTTIHQPRPNQFRYAWSMWEVASRRPRRPLETVILDHGTKENILDDINEYLQPNAAQWYASRGIPLRRGYLFYGPPGTGKTSFAFAIAGVFGLDIYFVHLNEVTEEDLHALFAKLPHRCIVLLEDVDSAGLRRASASSNIPEGVSGEGRRIKRGAGHQGERDSCGITLSGFLNVIDGVASHEGHVLIMTTNKPNELDEALIRPGRVDMQVPFENASSSQAVDLFHRTYGVTNPGGSKFYQCVVDPTTLASISADFGKLIPDGILSPAEIQGFLLKRRKTPHLAVQDAPAWVESTMKHKTEGHAVAGMTEKGLVPSASNLTECCNPDLLKGADKFLAQPTVSADPQELNKSTSKISQIL